MPERHRFIRFCHCHSGLPIDWCSNRLSGEKDRLIEETIRRFLDYIECVRFWPTFTQRVLWQSSRDRSLLCPPFPGDT